MDEAGGVSYAPSSQTSASWHPAAHSVLRLILELNGEEILRADSAGEKAFREDLDILWCLIRIFLEPDEA